MRPRRGAVRLIALVAISASVVVLGLGTDARLRAGPSAPLERLDAPAEKTDTYENPVIEGNLADPCVIFHEGVYYLYATGEVDGDSGTRVYTSPNLVDWERGPVVFRPGEPHVWAPDVSRDPRTGRFYLYYTVNQTVGVAEADGPLGPFAIRRRFFDRAIDAHLFRDDDERLYLYFVKLPGFRICVQPMASPTEPEGEPKAILWPEADWEKRAGEVTEGPWMLKRGGRYYLLYSGSGANTPDYAVGYAVSESPLGPFRRAAENPIVRRSESVFGPGHGCAIRDGAGRWWHVYHQKRTDRVEWDRFIAIDPLWFDGEGRLSSRATRGAREPAPVPPALPPLAPPGPGAAPAQIPRSPSSVRI
ncbi:MAG: glycoside hydrolase family 43 protein, partial [Planctomycetota bacterium]